MYGLISRMWAAPGKAEELAEMMLSGLGDMEGCLSYVIARDAKEADALWVTEIWDSAESHKASLDIPAVQSLIMEARPLIAGMDSRVETEPMGGVGI